MKVFIDCDVILDFLLNRQPFIDEITEIMELSAKDKLTLCVSPITITNLNYIIGRLENKTQANLKTKKILRLVTVENIGKSTVLKSTKSKFKDFEDGVQNFCAEESGHNTIITSNIKDYKESKLAVLTPKEFLAKIR